MRSLNFRDHVLFPIAYKLGLDPVQNFDDVQGLAIGKYINAWIRRTWPSLDWPEWSTIKEVAPVNHIVPYSSVIGDLRGVPTDIGKVMRVFLIDPRTADLPASDTPFTELAEGVHVGFDHGSSVWVKFLPVESLFTTEKWIAGRTYKKGEITYSPTTGECHVSKVNGNRNHDPAFEVQTPRDLTTEITQQHIDGSPGRAEQPLAIKVYFQQVSPSPAPPDPVLDGASFYIDVWDGPDEGTANLLGDANYLVSGSTSLATIIADMVTQLQAEPGLSTFTITGDTLNNTITIEDASQFYLIHRSYLEPPPDDTVTHKMNAAQVQPYLPAVSPDVGTPQNLTLSLTEDDIFKGGTYTMNFRDENGVLHTVTYDSLDSDGINEVVAGILAAISTAGLTDTFLASIVSTVDDTIITFSTPRAMSLDATVQRAGSPYWDIVPFPKELVEAVVRGANADTLKEWGQTDKGAAEEQGVPAEIGTRTTVGESQSYEQLMPRQPKSRYSL